MELDLEHHDVPGTVPHAILGRLQAGTEVLDPRAFCVGLALATHAQVEAADGGWRPVFAGECIAWVSAETLATEMGVSTRTVLRGLKDLRGLGVVIRRRAHHENFYMFPIDTTGFVPSPFPQCEASPPAPNIAEMNNYYAAIREEMWNDESPIQDQEEPWCR